MPRECVDAQKVPGNKWTTKIQCQEPCSFLEGWIESHPPSFIPRDPPGHHLDPSQGSPTGAWLIEKLRLCIMTATVSQAQPQVFLLTQRSRRGHCTQSRQPQHTTTFTLSVTKPPRLKMVLKEPLRDNLRADWALLLNVQTKANSGEDARWIKVLVTNLILAPRSPHGRKKTHDYKPSFVLYTCIMVHVSPPVHKL